MKVGDLVTIESVGYSRSQKRKLIWLITKIENRGCDFRGVLNLCKLQPTFETNAPPCWKWTTELEKVCK